MKHHKRTPGFTLIELLAVLAIMLILGGIAVGQYVDLRRGSGMRSSVSHVRSSATLARQMAITTGRRMHVTYQTGGGKSWFVIVGEEGEGVGSGDSLTDEFADWAGLGVGLRVYNLNNTNLTRRSSTIAETEQDPGTKVWALTTEESIWKSGLVAYGWDAHPKTTLPTGYMFMTNGIQPCISKTLVFNPDGTTEGYNNNGDYVIGIREELNPTSHSRITVKFPTGFVSVEYRN